MPDLLSSWTPTRLARFRRQLNHWFRGAARKLPWRDTDCPYQIWVSEIMLQQTTVKAVVPYFNRFIERFPTVEDLAAATEEEVLRYWEGLGYYSRGRNLKLGAQHICEQHAGKLPETVEELLQIPGIGRYTAGAILSFGFDKPAPILEANTLRLYARLLGYSENPRSTAGQRLLWSFAERLPSARNAGQLNQALMELGSLVCRPQTPNCAECPVQEFCEAWRANRVQEIPPPPVRPEITPLVEACTVVISQGRWLLRQCGPDERWTGLWDFPRCTLAGIEHRGPLTPAQQHTVRQQVQAFLRGSLGVSVVFCDQQQQIRHTVTRYRIRLLVLVAECEPTPYDTGEYLWIDPREIDQFPLSVTGRKIAMWMSQGSSAARN